MTAQISGLRGRQPHPLMMSDVWACADFALKPLFFLKKKVNWWNPEIKMWVILWGLLRVHLSSSYLTCKYYISLSTHTPHGIASVDWWILPVSVFADIWPERTSAGFWAIEIRQDVFRVFVISRLAHDLFDDTGGDGYSTLGSIFILPERQIKTFLDSDPSHMRSMSLAASVHLK